MEITKLKLAVTIINAFTMYMYKNKMFHGKIEICKYNFEKQVYMLK